MDRESSFATVNVKKLFVTPYIRNKNKKQELIKFNDRRKVQISPHGWLCAIFSVLSLELISTKAAPA